MFRLVRSGIFPPLPETGNKRSLVHVDDVVDAMRRMMGEARANGQTYIVTGPRAYSGRELYDAMRAAAGMPRSSWAVPRFVLRALAAAGDLGGALLKRRLPFDGEVLDRLLGSAWYSGARLERELHWRARIDLAEGLASLMVPE
jgi:nucleoside-diphosphate-sugar epimerase